MNIEQAIIRGGNVLSGSIRPAGFKHSFVTTVAATLLGETPFTLGRVPNLVESDTIAKLLRRMGANVDRDREFFSVDASTVTDGTLDPLLCSTIHGVSYLAPAILSRFGRARIPGAGGCQIGTEVDGRRSTAHYCEVLERFGAKTLQLGDGGFEATASKLHSTDIDLADFAGGRLLTGPHYSGATKMAILTSVRAEGTTVLRNPYPKADVTDLVSVLSLMGSDIRYDADGTIRVTGGLQPKAALYYEMPPDLIEIVTWICAAQVLKSHLILTDVDPVRVSAGLQSEFDLLAKMGMELEFEHSAIRVKPVERLRPFDVTIESTGIYSDSAPFFALMATEADGRSKLRETVWTKRFDYVSELNSLGAHMELRSDILAIEGGHPVRLSGHSLQARELRGAAALLIAALAVDGETHLSGLSHLARGYEDLPATLRRLGGTVMTTQESQSCNTS